jgi:hypothetical protein
VVLYRVSNHIVLRPASLLPRATAPPAIIQCSVTARQIWFLAALCVKISTCMQPCNVTTGYLPSAKKHAAFEVDFAKFRTAMDHDILLGPICLHRWVQRTFYGSLSSQRRIAPCATEGLALLAASDSYFCHTTNAQSIWVAVQKGLACRGTIAADYQAGAATCRADTSGKVPSFRDSVMNSPIGLRRFWCGVGKCVFDQQTAPGPEVGISAALTGLRPANSNVDERTP